MAEKIKQPKNAAIKAKKAEVNLVWKRTFSKEQTDRFTDMQESVDEECIKRMEPYTPERNGYLSHGAPKNGTVIGSGHIYYAAPYARYQYYGKLMVSSVTGSSYAKKGESKVLTGKNLQYETYRHPKAQRLWFEKMKTEHGEAILRGAAAAAKRNSK